MAIFNGGAGNDVLRGTNNADLLNGGAGDDTLSGGGGTDVLFGGAGRDTLDGGSGSDVVDGGLGDDLLIYRFGENRGAYDVYNGGFGRDTLRLVFTAAEWDAAAVRQDVHRFLAYLPEYNEPLGWITDPLFVFGSLGLAVVGINKLEVVVDGKLINAADAPVILANDTLAVTQDTGATVDVLANDKVADGVRSVSVTQPAKGTVELVSSDLAGATPSAVFRFDPGDSFDGLAEGQTATQVFTYTVTDKDGDKKTASVTVTVTGTNDRPEVTSATAAMNADGVLTGTLAGNARDVDGDTLSFGYSRWSAPAGFDMNSDGSWTFDPQATGFFGQSERATVNRLKAGETLTYEISYYVYDPSYAFSENATLTITVTGVNDAAILSGYFSINEDSSEWVVANGIHSMSGSFGVFDWDGEDGQAVVTLIDSPADALGTLIMTGYDAETGRYGYRLNVDSAALAALEEGELRTQSYRFQVDDGQGAVTIETVDFKLVGDGNDPVEVPDFPLFDDDPVDVDGIRTGSFNITFDDEDRDDLHSATVSWIDPDALGEISVQVLEDEDGDPYLSVTYRVPVSRIDAVVGDIEQAFRVTLTDNAGSTVEFERSVEINYDTWQIGGGGDELIEGADGSRTRDILIGGAGSDRLVGGGGRDWLYGDAGPALPDHKDNAYEWWPQDWTPVEGFNDELEGGAGADRLTGGAGADRFVFRRGETNGDEITDFSSAEGDKLVFFDWGAGASFTRLDATHWQVKSADGRFKEVITIVGGPELTPADIVFEERDVEWRVGGDTDDDLYAPENEARHVLIGGAGRDYLSGNAFDDTLYGDEGPLLPADKENLFDGTENWSSGEYDDELNGYGGADLLVGGAGADRFIFNRGEAEGDVVRDFNGLEGDRLDFSDFGSRATLTRIDATRWEIADEDRDHVETITLANGYELDEADVILPGYGTDWWIGGEGDDDLATPSGGGRYVLIGGGGRDNLVGDSGDDELYGDEGPALPNRELNLFDGDSYSASDEYDDVLNGYEGADLLVGGAGGDLFRFYEDQADGDTVRDFNGEEGDRLDFTDYGVGATFTQIDRTHWRIANRNGDEVDVITFTNAPVILPEYLLML